MPGIDTNDIYVVEIIFTTGRISYAVEFSSEARATRFIDTINNIFDNVDNPEYLDAIVDAGAATFEKMCIVELCEELLKNPEIDVEVKIQKIPPHVL